MLWHCYGEQPTRWSHALGRPVVPPTPLPGVRDPTNPQAVPASMATAAGRATAKRHAVAFSCDRPCGLFRHVPTDSAAQDELPSALDKSPSPATAQATLGPAVDGTLSAEEM